MGGQKTPLLPGRADPGGTIMNTSSINWNTIARMRLTGMDPPDSL